jgi:3-isopropylmalate dehydrogenase
MTYSIALIPGDGIGPDVTSQAVEVLDAVGDRFGHVFNYVELLAGGCSIDASGVPLTDEALESAKACDAVLLGAVGGPQWETLPGNLRPERALLGLRAGLGVYANLRPAALLPQLKAACPIKDEVLVASNHEGKAAFDLLIVRELTGGLYFGERGRSADGQSAFDTETYSKMEIERVLRAGYRAAQGRRKKLCVVDKANVLESSRLWREVAAVVAKDYPGIETSYMYVDNCAMQLIRDPRQFDVIVTTNIFGDILSDEASQLTGSIGMLASASMGGPVGFFEPIHGSAPDIAGQQKANPLATIGTVSMLLRYGLKLTAEADLVEGAIRAVLKDGLRTGDIARTGEKVLGTREMGDAVVARLKA